MMAFCTATTHAKWNSLRALGFVCCCWKYWLGTRCARIHVPTVQKAHLAGSDGADTRFCVDSLSPAVRQGGERGRGSRGISALEGGLAILRSGMTDVDVLVCQ